jgi:hypothetical protein
MNTDKRGRNGTPTDARSGGHQESKNNRLLLQKNDTTSASVESSSGMLQLQSPVFRPANGILAQPPRINQSRYFCHLTSGVNVAPVLAELQANEHLWGQQKARIAPNSPHSQTKDIWLRYRDLDDYIQKYGSNMEHFTDEHESVWLRPADALPRTVRLAEALAGHRRLGGVLLSFVPPGCGIDAHVDFGWHATAHDKIYVALQVRPGARFCWEDGVIEARDGDVWGFRNDVPHWVENDSDLPRISMIVCLGKPN